MHGELVGFGILVQHVLSGDDAALEKTAAWFAEIGCPSDLEALGCGEYAADAGARETVLRRACDSVPLTAAFPGIEPKALGMRWLGLMLWLERLVRWRSALELSRAQAAASRPPADCVMA